MSFDSIKHTNGLFHKIKFYIVYDKIFLLLIHFLVVEDYEFPKSTSHVLIVPLTLEYVRILPWSISFVFYFNCLPMMFCVRLLSELIILLPTHHITDDRTCLNKLRFTMSCNLILKTWKCNTRSIRKCNSTSNYILIFRKLFYIYKLIHIDCPSYPSAPVRCAPVASRSSILNDKWQT